MKHYVIDKWLDFRSALLLPPVLKDPSHVHFVFN